MKLRWVTLCAVVLGGVACGGGGGGGSDVPFFGGVWRGSMSLLENTCPTQEGFLPDVVHTVNQSDTRVVLEPRGGATTYEGVVEGTDGFLVSQEVARQEIANGVVCDLSAAIRYSDIKDNQATVESAARLRCLGQGQSYECKIRHFGVMERQ